MGVRRKERGKSREGKNGREVERREHREKRNGQKQC